MAGRISQEDGSVALPVDTLPLGGRVFTVLLGQGEDMEKET